MLEADRRGELGLRYFLLFLTCAVTGCSTTNQRIDGRYVGPGGATLVLAGNNYEFCDKACTRGRMEVRPLGKRSGRLTLFGIPVGAYFRNAQQGSPPDIRSWGDGVETSYSFGVFGGAYIDIDSNRGLRFKRSST